MLFYQLDIASLVLALMLFVVVMLRKSFPTVQRRMLKIVILLEILSSGSELFSVYLVENIISAPIMFKTIFIMVTLAIHTILHLVFILYSLTLCRGKLGNLAEKIFIFIIYGALLFFILTTPSHGLTFYFTEDGEYVAKLPLAIMEIIGALSVVYSIGLLIYSRERMAKYELALYLFFLFAWIASIILETIFSKHIFYVENFTITVTFAVITIIMDNPSQYFYKNTFVYNESTFNKVYGNKIKKQQPFKIAAFAYKDFDLSIQKLGKARAGVAYSETLINCRKKYGTSNVYSLGRNVVVLDLNKVNDIESELKDIAAECYRGGQLHNRDLKLQAQFVVVDYPTDVDNIQDLHDVIYLMLFDQDVVGDNLITFFKKDLLEKKHRHDRLILKLHDAIENDGFEMFYQPLFDWKKNKFIALEALIRFKDNGEEFFSPAEFIPIAENEGLIFDIDEIVFEKVCRFIRNNDIIKYGIQFIDINLSLLKLLDPSSVDRYSELVSRYNIDPSFINLEITETAEGDDKYLNVVRQNIARFREKGFNFSLDDYGSGYSTVIYMAEMDAKIVKIDASILWNAMKNKKYYTVLENCVRLIYCFDKDCVCEGVEDEKMVAVLKKLGVQYFQGYYYSKPLNEESIISYLNDKNGVIGPVTKK